MSDVDEDAAAFERDNAAAAAASAKAQQRLLEQLDDGSL